MTALQLQSTQTLRSNRTASGSRRIAPATDRTGEVIAGKWRLDRALGVGGAGAVYAAVHQNGKRVAIKVLHPELVQDADVKARFLFEPSVTNRIRHPGVVSIHDDGVTPDGSPFFVMDLLEGETLEDRVEKQGALSLSVAVGITLQVLDVLVAVHGQGIVHLDIKPSNIFLAPDGRVYLLDFGVARVSEGPRWTQPGIAIGTPMFMAPEQANADWGRVDERCDLWGVAAVMRYALTARYLRSGSSVEQVMVQARSQAVTPAASLGIVAPMAAFLDRALAFRPQQRFGSALVMRHTLGSIWTRLAAKLSPDAEVITKASAGVKLLPAPTTTGAPVSSGILAGRTNKRSKAAWAVMLLLPSALAVAGYGRSHAADPTEQIAASGASEPPTPTLPPMPSVPRPPAPVPSVPPVPTPTPTPAPSPIAPTRHLPHAVVSAVSERGGGAGHNEFGAARPSFRAGRAEPSAGGAGSLGTQHDPMARRGGGVSAQTLTASTEPASLERRLPSAGLDPIATTAANASHVLEDPLAARL